MRRSRVTGGTTTGSRAVIRLHPGGMPEAPGGSGPLRVDLALNGARAEAAAIGVRLALNIFGRRPACRGLRVVDARGREMPARLEVPAARRLAVVVEDAGAVHIASSVTPARFRRARQRRLHLAPP